MVSLKRVGIFLQVRLNSTRMPGKALEKLDDKTLLQHALERLQIVPADVRAILTNTDSVEMLREIAEGVGWEVYTGNSQNVLRRYVEAALHYGITVVVRATGDNPFVSSEIARETIDIFSSKKCDLAYLKPIPYGSGVEVVKTEVLINALENTNIPYHLEHVTPYIYENRDKFRIFEGKFHDDRIAREDVRLTIDTREDFERMKFLLSELKKKKRRMKILELINLYDRTDFTKIKKALFIVSFGSHYGIGHLKRALFIAKKLQDNFRIYFTFKYKSSNNNEFLEALADSKIEFLDYNKVEEFIMQEGSFDRIIIDTRDTTIEEMLYYNSLGPTISIDDSGAGANLSKIIIRTLPVNNLSLSNFEGIEYLFTDLTNKVSRKISQDGDRPRKILVTFGGSDPANLTQLLLNIFQNLNYEVVVIQGPYFSKSIPLSDTYKVVTNPTVLTPYILEADIVITSFGLTLFEAFLLKKPVIVINPSEYHDILTKQIDYPYFIEREKGVLPSKQVKDKIEVLIKQMLNDKIFDEDITHTPMDKFYSLNIGQSFGKIVNFINEWTPSSHLCPNCSSFDTKVIHRENRYNMLKCKKCDLIYLVHIDKNSVNYNDDYFTTEYKQQYGKSYEEDKDNIRILGKKRLEIIKKYKSKGKLLDFGAGLGFFTELCEEEGYKTISLDISQYAIRYIKENLGQEAICTDQSYFERSNEVFDVISSFYVIEHIQDFEKLIFMFTQHLSDTGVIALATPNKNGISIKKNFSQYVKKHPIDHYRIFSPKLLKTILKKYGYKKIKIVITGIHLDRFVDMDNIVIKILMKNKFTKSLLIKLINFYAKMFQLGDTFEIYGQKG